MGGPFFMGGEWWWFGGRKYAISSMITSMTQSKREHVPRSEWYEGANEKCYKQQTSIYITN